MISQSCPYVSDETQWEENRSPPRTWEGCDQTRGTERWRWGRAASCLCSPRAQSSAQLLLTWKSLEGRSCDLVRRGSSLSSPLLWRKLLQLLSEHDVPLISCQLCSAEQLLLGRPPPSSPPPCLPSRSCSPHNQLEVCPTAWGAWGSHPPPQTQPSMAGQPGHRGD